MAMRMAVLSPTEKILCFLDSEIKGLIYNDEQETVLDGRMWTMDFTMDNRTEESEHVQIGNHVAWREGDRDYYGVILKTEETPYSKTVHVETLSLELLNEMATKYEYSGTFSGHIKKMGGETLDIQIGLNEISDRTRSMNFDSEETLLKRIISIAMEFDAEIEFRAELNNDYSLNHYLLNVYKKKDDQNAGMGKTHPGFIRDGIQSITRTADISELYTHIEPTGKDGLTISSIGDRTIKDDDGVILYQHKAGTNYIRAPQARDRFPATFDRFGGELWIASYPSWEYETAEDLYGHALSELKKHSVPQMSYEVSGLIDGEVGDTVTIIDDRFNPEMILTCRIVKTRKSRTNPASNTYELDNFSEMFKEGL